MLRITELRLPLGHSPEALTQAIVERLDADPSAVVAFRMARRAHDARNRSAIAMVYSVDVTLVDEEAVLARFAGDHRVKRTPDTGYVFVPNGRSAGGDGLGHEASANSGHYPDPPHAKRLGEAPSSVFAVDGRSAAGARSRDKPPSPVAPPRLKAQLPAPDGAHPIQPVDDGRDFSAALATPARDDDVRDRPVVVGAGPCGLFAALILAQMGLRPIILDRGKVVRERTKDTWGLWRQGVLHPESNVQFGEGGAGTFSDGKLWSQIKDPRHLGRKVLIEMVEAGAPEEILVEAHPHIGTFRLVTVVENLRRTIEGLGGEYRFEQKVDDFDIVVDRDGSRRLRGLHFEGGGHLATGPVVLAVGHSARDTFGVLHRRGVHMEAKPFSIGVRIEHPQSWIDEARFGSSAGHPDLGAADYTLSHHCTAKANVGRTVYSFCMCPGGTVVAAASEPGRLVVNGMSQYSRNERNANSGLVVGIDPARDYPGDPLAGIALQRHWEALAFEAGGSNYEAPVQTVGDFLRGRPSTALGEVVPSYKPGVRPTDMALCLPDFVTSAIREALPVFGRQIRGYDHPDAVLTGIEARTSSPLRISRGGDFQSLNTVNLYPAGEGAGYAGGILSAAVDGIKVAEAVALSMSAIG